MTDIWKDFDVMSHEVGVLLGVFPEGSKMSDFKAVFWSQNEKGESLIRILDELVKIGVITAA